MSGNTGTTHHVAQLLLWHSMHHPRVVMEMNGGRGQSGTKWVGGVVGGYGARVELAASPAAGKIFPG